jgi:hypothetical protein
MYDKLWVINSILLTADLIPVYLKISSLSDV